MFLALPITKTGNCRIFYTTPLLFCFLQFQYYSNYDRLTHISKPNSVMIKCKLYDLVLYVTDVLTSVNKNNKSRNQIICYKLFAHQAHSSKQQLCKDNILVVTVYVNRQGVYKFNGTNFQIPGGILRKIQEIFALLRLAM